MYVYFSFTSEFIGRYPTPYHGFYNLSFFRICLFSLGFYFDSALILWAMAIKLCMAVGARPRARSLIVCLNYRRCFMLCLMSCVGSGDMQNVNIMYIVHCKRQTRPLVG
jgi:hypothetical protein